MPGPVFLEGGTVTLHPAEEEDIDFLRENEQHPRIRASRSMHSPLDADWARQRLGGTMGREGNTLGLLICDDRVPVGFVYLIRERPNAGVFHLAEVAYWVAPDEWGNGYATAGTELLLDHAFGELGLHRVEASAFDSNGASKRVLEKLGFTREGIARNRALVDGEWTDMVRYGLLVEDWRDAETE